MSNASITRPTETPGKLWRYADFAHRLPAGLKRGAIQRMSAAGLFPAFTRLSPKSQAVWSADAVTQWLDAKLIELEVAW